MDDLYRAADQTWNVHLIDDDVFWLIVYANRRAATNADRAALVRAIMDAEREDMGADEDYVRSSMRDQWERRRAAQQQGGEWGPPHRMAPRHATLPLNPL